MSLKKSWLIKNTKSEMEKLGFLEMEDTVTGASGLFVKKVAISFYLSIGYIISNLYESRFTASFYLSKTTRWSSIWGDIPKESYQRVGYFLTREERKLYLDLESQEENVVDAWWRGSENDIDKFTKAIKITETRFLQQENLFSKIQNSTEINDMITDALNVQKMVSKNYIDEGYQYKFIPKAAVDDIPLAWFKAAEIVIKNSGSVLNNKTVKLLAADAWRQMKYTKISSEIYQKG